MQRRIITGIMAIVVAMPGFCICVASRAGAEAGITPARVGKTAPNFILEDADGKSVNLSDYRGKVVLLDFWATWCHGCKLEIPWFMEFEDRYKESGLVTIGVSMDDDGWKSVRPFISENELNYIVVIGNESLGKQYGLGAVPMTALIKRDGTIAAIYNGVVDKAACEREIKKLLAEKYPGAAN